jgi:hypothetical protein
MEHNRVMLGKKQHIPELRRELGAAQACEIPTIVGARDEQRRNAILPHDLSGSLGSLVAHPRHIDALLPVRRSQSESELGCHLDH